MLQRWLFREPALSFGVPVFVCAAVLFPLHLGWTGTPPGPFLGYLAVAAIVFSLADAWTQSDFYDRWEAVLLQSCLCGCGLAIPAALAFAIGSVAGPVDEALDEEVCASQGAFEADTPAAEVDDTFDVTADCIADA
jgi:hypothetical protein